jgi:hypothetical protein
MTSNLISLAIVIAILVWMAFLDFAHAQNCVTTYSGSTYSITNCYDYGGGVGEAMGDIADQMQRQAAINSYRQVHGLPKCSAFPIFHWDGLPGC